MVQIWLYQVGDKATVDMVTFPLLASLTIDLHWLNQQSIYDLTRSEAHKVNETIKLNEFHPPTYPQSLLIVIEYSVIRNPKRMAETKRVALVIRY